MADCIISIEHLSKEYRLGTINHGTLYRDLQSWSAKMLGKVDPNSKIASVGGKVQNGTFKALNDVSFEVKQGDVLGVIGRNGAGKSTLLKIISQVTSPSSGMIKIRGRVASLLEVGTGFHPELTGRDNIFLNGAILGMTKQEIKSKFDEIVGFAEIETFIDTPVKRYSSGMYVRLAFAVAAHLEPEILVVDEVLAVGDVQFQKKCLGKMRDVGKEGRTVLFVSHNMAAISSLCKGTVVLKSGEISFNGDVERGIDYYLEDVDHVKGFADLQDKDSNLPHPHNLFSKLLRVETLDENGRRQSSFKMGRCLKVGMRLEIMDDRQDIELAISICNSRETILGVLLSTAEGFTHIRRGINDIQVDIPELDLMPGEYGLSIGVFHQHQADDGHVNVITIDVISDNFTGNYVDFNRFREYGSIIRSNWKNVN